MTVTQNGKPYDLGERTKLFAKEVIAFQKGLEKSTPNFEITRQLIRSAGSVGANYIEANESFSKKDFELRIKICRKEAKEACYWLDLLEIKDDMLGQKRKELMQESTELVLIFNAIVEKKK
ncbi:MAG TPA: four helix bundle protein [Dehalococcoidales bacterium]|nr:four helix bundle protein [Dehalococcoidales bacterium]